MARYSMLLALQGHRVHFTADQDVCIGITDIRG